MREKTGTDGLLHLCIPVGVAEAECEVVVVVQADAPQTRPPSPQRRGWPPGFFENVVGSITDDTFVRPPQGNYEQRLGME
jgi:hypothetical protein